MPRVEGEKTDRNAVSPRRDGDNVVVLSETDARSAAPVGRGRMRYVLAISLTASIVALAIVLFAYV